MNKTVLITGASKGIGFALANKFLENGFKVIGTSTSGKIDGIENDNFEIVQLDLSEYKNIELFSKDIVMKGVKIDILINNAGIGPDLDFMYPEEITFKHYTVEKGYFEVRINNKLYDTKVFIK